jgi:BlaI family penicillinase repressor
MSKTPRISESEWEVMKALWEKSPLTANEIVEILTRKTSWHRETIRTLINRLVQKGALAFKKEGRQHQYYPCAAEVECIRAEAQFFLRRVRASAIEPMLAAFVEEHHLSTEQIARLKQILDGKDPDAKHGKAKRP